MRTRFLLFIILALALASTGLAQGVEDFSLGGSTVVDAFQCTTTTTSFSVTNTGIYISTYSIYADGSAADWAAFGPLQFVLNPGETQVITEQITVPCDASGEHTLSITVVTAAELEATLEQTINVNIPMNIDVTATQHAQTIMPCGVATFEMDVYNPLDFEETYNLSLDQFAEEVTWGKNPITLAANETLSTFFTITPTDCSASGDFVPTLTIETNNTGLEAGLDFSLTITNTGIVTIASNVKTIKTTYNESEVAIAVQNEGNESATYNVYLEGAADWISPKSSTLTLAGDAKDNVTLTFSPQEDTRAGSWPITLVLESDDTGNLYKKHFDVKLAKPNIIEKTWEAYQMYILIGLAVIILLIILVVGMAAYRKSEAYERHKAEREKRKAIKALEAEEKRKEKEKDEAFKKKEDERKEKEKQREKERAQREHDRLKHKFEQELKKDNKIIAKKDIADLKKAPLKWPWGIILILLLIAVGVGSYFALDFIKANMVYAIAGITAVVIILVILLISHAVNRATKQSWDAPFAPKGLRVTIDGWKTGVSQVRTTLSAPVSTPKITLKKGATTDAEPNGLVYKKFSINTNFEADLTKTQVTLKVSKKWLEQNNISEKGMKLVAFTGTKWQSKSTTHTSSDKKYAYYTCTPDAPGEYAIVGTSKKEKKAMPWKGVWATIGILILIAAVVTTYMIASPTAVEMPIEVKGIPAQTWFAGDIHAIDLTQYFSDPDNDDLNFDSQAGEHINVTIIDGVAYLEPEQDWTGESSVVFAADDGKGGVVSSNTVKLKVKKSTIPTNWKTYAQPVLWGVLILIVLILLIEFRSKIFIKKPKKRKK